MRNDKEVGTYGWFREHGHARIKALKRTLEFELEGWVPFPRYAPREKYIDDALEGLDKRLRYISRVDYNPKNIPPNTHSVETLIMGSYDYLQKQPSEYFNERTAAEYQKLEKRIFKLQQDGKLPFS